MAHPFARSPFSPQTYRDVTYTVTGPATLTGPYTQLGQALTITGAGAVSVTANQPASSYYQAATPVVRTFSVAPALLTLTAQNATKFLGAPLPSLAANITGYVNGETSAVLGGAPLVSTTATDSSPAGSYPITVSQGTLTAANYNFQFVNGTLTVPPVPVANAQPVTAAYNTAKPVTLNGSGLGTLAYTVVSQPAHGTLSGTAPNLTYTPASNFSGSDSFTFTVTDGASQDSAPATVSITVAAPDLTLGPVSGGSTSATVTAGNSTVFNLQASGWNGATGPITFACSGAPTGATCAVSPGSATLNGTTPIAITVRCRRPARKPHLPAQSSRPNPEADFPGELPSH